MNIIISLILVITLSYLFSEQIKKYSTYVYIVLATLSLLAIINSILKINSYTVEYAGILNWLMKDIDSGAMGGALFILVMYMGVFDMKANYARRLRLIRAELSIIACMMTIPHNIHYFFKFLLNINNIVKTKDISLWFNLMMFASGVFAISIMIPLFITSFKNIRKKMSAKAWKNLQEYAYIFYAMIFVQVMMVYMSRPSDFIRNMNIVFYLIIFTSYTVLKLRLVYSKRKNKKNSNLAIDGSSNF